MKKLFDTAVQKLKYKVLREVARLAFEDQLDSGALLDIPAKIMPGPKPTMRCCIYKERAIINSRLKRVVYGARDPKAGCCGSLTDLFALPFNHHPVMEQGLLEEEAQALLQEFFAGLRAKRLKLKAEKRAQQAAPLQNEENPHE